MDSSARRGHTFVELMAACAVTGVLLLFATGFYRSSTTGSSTTSSQAVLQLELDATMHRIVADARRMVVEAQTMPFDPNFPGAQIGFRSECQFTAPSAPLNNTGLCFLVQRIDASGAPVGIQNCFDRIVYSLGGPNNQQLVRGVAPNFNTGAVPLACPASARASSLDVLTENLVPTGPGAVGVSFQSTRSATGIEDVAVTLFGQRIEGNSIYRMTLSSRVRTRERMNWP